MKAIVFDFLGVIYVDSELDKELLGFIKQLNSDYKTAILSNINQSFLDQVFDKAKPISDFFDEVVTSSETGVSKPDPEAYRIVCQRLDVTPDQAVFIDDSISLCEGAEAVGMTTIVYQNFDQMKKALSEILNQPKT